MTDHAWESPWVPFDGIMATGTRDIPLAAHLADRLHLPMIYLRDAPKKHGTKKRYEGEINVKRYLIIGDYEKGVIFCLKNELTPVRLAQG